MGELSPILVSLLLLTFGSAPSRAQETLPNIVVQADSSLSLPMAEIARQYARTYRSAVALGFTAVQTEDNQIAEGSTADVLITANIKWLDSLKQQGLVDIYSEAPIAKDKLVLTAPPGSHLTADLAQGFPTGRMLIEMGENRIFLLGNPETLPEGSAGRDALRRMNASADLEPYTLYQKDRKTMHDMIRNQGAYGVLLSSDAHQRQLKIVSEFPQEYHAPVIYKAVVLAGENMNYARMFVEYLKSPEAKAILTGHTLAMP